MERFLWHLDAEGWPLKRIDTQSGENVRVFTRAAMGWFRQRLKGVRLSSDIRNWSSGDTKSGPPCGA